MTALPEPMLPPEVDLRDFEFMPLSVRRFRDSDLVSLEPADAVLAAVLLWGAAWHQVPAGSLPDDDRILASLAGFGRAVGEWVKVRDGALRGFIKCSDGRLYHPVVVEKAIEAWQGKLKKRWQTYCAALKKSCQRRNLPYNPPTFDEWKEQGQPTSVPRDNHDCPQGQDGNVPGTDGARPGSVPRENTSKGEGEGEGQGLINNSLSPYRDPRLDIDGLCEPHAVDWQPDTKRLSAEMQRQGVPMPSSESFERSLRRFNLNYSGKALTVNQQYGKLVAWLDGDRNDKRTSPRLDADAPDQQPRGSTPLERVQQRATKRLGGG